MILAQHMAREARAFFIGFVVVMFCVCVLFCVCLCLVIRSCFHQSGLSPGPISGICVLLFGFMLCVCMFVLCLDCGSRFAVFNCCLCPVWVPSHVCYTRFQGVPPG